MLLINLAGVLLIAFIIWWFWLYKAQHKLAAVGNKSSDELTIVVQDGVFQPATIAVPADTEITLQFMRKDATLCAATLLFPDFEISTELPINKNVAVNLPKMKKGTYPFHCQMQMYKGELFVK